MNPQDREKWISVGLSLAIIACCFTGILLLLSMSRRENILVNDVNFLVIQSNQYHKNAIEFNKQARIQSEIIQNMSEELKAVHNEHYLLRKIAEKFNIQQEQSPADHP